MLRTSLSPFQYFPILALTICMVVGGYHYDKTLDEWVTGIIGEHMSSILDDVVRQTQDKHIDLYDMSESEIDDFLDSLPQASFSQRFTIIHSSGLVLGDSQLTKKEIYALDDHSDRAEVIDALSSEIGIARRFSASLNQELLYVAKKLELLEHSHEHNSVYVLRLAMPMSALYAMSADLKFIEHAFMVSALMILLLATWFSHRQVFKVVQAEKKQQTFRIQKSTREIELLHQLANMLAACNTINEAQVVVADIIPRILGNLNGCVSIMRESRNQLEVKLDWGGEWPAGKLYAPNECWALRKGKFHLSHEQYHNLPCTHMNQCEINDPLTMCIPLTAHGHTVGMFHLCLDGTDTLTDDTKRLAFTIAEHLGLALANLSLQEKLRSQAMRDPLTGLFNRRYFEEVFEKEWAEASQSNTPVSLLMLDLDHFKRFNDNFGHDAGDYVLKEVANLLTREISEKHIACRLGGEELAVISPNCTIKESIALANQIVNSVRTLHLDMKGLSLGQLGVSIGVVTYPDFQGSTTELVKAADTALYQAKDNGRSQAIHTQVKLLPTSGAEALSIK
ncbi:GGDEF domain-containing protein [Vibrio sp. SCSIO 43169]|uniref:sensor domain-containing diguanylate cyclase n=1 Tax=Vibrio sp. SCSIO 43169 TaxID=2822801 RepID=UPI0020441DE5|nr:GGDEF domain-containing protein [Vibrio sp. SCSIO 43169]MCM5511093.1 GGDEF domain-containing protein [Vibrio sp. SCSIO 43169]